MNESCETNHHYHHRIPSNFCRPLWIVFGPPNRECIQSMLFLWRSVEFRTTLGSWDGTKLFASLDYCWRRRAPEHRREPASTHGMGRDYWLCIQTKTQQRMQMLPSIAGSGSMAAGESDCSQKHPFKSVPLRRNPRSHHSITFAH